jgi:hypothetical protein
VTHYMALLENTSVMPFIAVMHAEPLSGVWYARAALNNPLLPLSKDTVKTFSITATRSPTPPPPLPFSIRCGAGSMMPAADTLRHIFLGILLRFRSLPDDVWRRTCAQFMHFLAYMSSVPTGGANIMSAFQRSLGNPNDALETAARARVMQNGNSASSTTKHGHSSASDDVVMLCVEDFVSGTGAPHSRERGCDKSREYLFVPGLEEETPGPGMRRNAPERCSDDRSDSSRPSGVHSGMGEASGGQLREMLMCRKTWILRFLAFEIHSEMVKAPPPVRFQILRFCRPPHFDEIRARASLVHPQMSIF